MRKQRGRFCMRLLSADVSALSTRLAASTSVDWLVVGPGMPSCVYIFKQKRPWAAALSGCNSPYSHHSPARAVDIQTFACIDTYDCQFCMSSRSLQRSCTLSTCMSRVSRLGHVTRNDCLLIRGFEGTYTSSLACTQAQRQ